MEQNKLKITFLALLFCLGISSTLGLSLDLSEDPTPQNSPWIHAMLTRVNPYCVDVIDGFFSGSVALFSRTNPKPLVKTYHCWSIENAEIFSLENGLESQKNPIKTTIDSCWKMIQTGKDLNNKKFIEHQNQPNVLKSDYNRIQLTNGILGGYKRNYTQYFIQTETLEIDLRTNLIKNLASKPNSGFIETASDLGVTVWKVPNDAEISGLDLYKGYRCMIQKEMISCPEFNIISMEKYGKNPCHEAIGNVKLQVVLNEPKAEFLGLEKLKLQFEPKENIDNLETDFSILWKTLAAPKAAFIKVIDIPTKK